MSRFAPALLVMIVTGCVEETGGGDVGGELANPPLADRIEMGSILWEGLSGNTPTNGKAVTMTVHGLFEAASTFPPRRLTIVVYAGSWNNRQDVLYSDSLDVVERAGSFRFDCPYVIQSEDNYLTVRVAIFVAGETTTTVYDYREFEVVNDI
jgi:hypothetical protein